MYFIYLLMQHCMDCFIQSYASVCSYKLLGREADAEEIIDTTSKASFGDQQKQVQENIYSQIKGFSAFKDDILLLRKHLWTHESSNQINSVPRQSRLRFAIGSNDVLSNKFPRS